MMKNNDFKLLKSFALGLTDERTNGQTDKRTNGMTFAIVELRL